MPDLLNTVLWYPMRVTYHREMRIKAFLDKMAVEKYVPMNYKWVNTENGGEWTWMPAIHNLIFIHASRKDITEMKHNRAELSSLRFMTRPVAERTEWEVFTVPDREMESFMRVASAKKDVEFLDIARLADRIGKPVRVMDGPFKGVEGTILRIRKNKYVVVKIEGICAVGITYVPPSQLEML